MPWEKSFDTYEALEGALRAFWSHGYEGTSLNALLDAMGIRRGSFYATFGSKKAVFLQALELYVQRAFDELNLLPDAASPLLALKKHFKSLADEATCPTSTPGCFVANCAFELRADDADIRALIQSVTQRHIDLYRRTLDAAKSKQELPSSFASVAVAETLFALVLGIRALARAGASAETIMHVRDQALRMISRKNS